MAFVRELDDLRRELRQGVAGAISFLPKVDGLNVVATAATFEVFGPSGTSIQSGTATLTSIDSGGATRIDCAVAAIATLDEDYQVRITWRATGESTDRFDVVSFDVVLWPFGETSVSLHDLRELRVDITEALDLWGQRLGQSPGDTAQEYAAAVAAVRARIELEALVRDATIEQGGTRPNLVINRERLARVEKYLAARCVYEALAADPDQGADTESALYRHFREMAASAWRSVGPLKFAAESSLDPSTTHDNVGRSVRLRRVQG